MGQQSSIEPRGESRARRRFLHSDSYRVHREWNRYEGTPQRDLFRQLRERFLERHRDRSGSRALEVGPGPGRFSGFVGSPGGPLVQLDLSRKALEFAADRAARRTLERDVSQVRGDALFPPFRPGSFGTVVALGNVIGFAEEDALVLLRQLFGLAGPGGEIVLETVAGDGERSEYLHRLPIAAVGRLFDAPVRAILPRVAREGFGRARRVRVGPRRFRRLLERELSGALRSAGFAMVEAMAVAPCLGNDPSRIAAIRPETKAWAHLLEVEETFGRDPARREVAASLLICAARDSASSAANSNGYD